MERPENMDFETYRDIRSQRTKQIRKYLKGKLIWASKKYDLLGPIKIGETYEIKKHGVLK